MKTLTEAAQVAAIIRKHLKVEGIAATVRSQNFSMGNDVNVHLLNDPTAETVKAVTQFCAKFRDGRFNSMEDLYEYNQNSDDSIPHTKYLFVEVRYSDEVKAEASDYVRSLGRDPDDLCLGDPVWMALNGSLGNFWTARLAAA